ncbi:MAG: hypothetical protein AB7G93_01535 [Bdellovibrionales bacterium]
MNSIRVTTVLLASLFFSLPGWAQTGTGATGTTEQEKTTGTTDTMSPGETDADDASLTPDQRRARQKAMDAQQRRPQVKPGVPTTAPTQRDTGMEEDTDTSAD